jgi:hypothetical protein
MQSWGNDTTTAYGPSDAIVGSPSWSSTRYHGGSHSFAFRAVFNPGSTSSVFVGVPFCSGSLVGYTVSGYIYTVSDGGGSTPLPQGKLAVYTNRGLITQGPLPGASTWSHFTGTIAYTDAVAYVGLSLVVTASWSGTIYLDDISINAF